MDCLPTDVSMHFFVALSASARHIHFLLRGGRSARLIVYRFLGLYLSDGSALRTAKGALRCSAGGSRLAVAGFVSAVGSGLAVAGFVSAVGSRLVVAGFVSAGGSRLVVAGFVSAGGSRLVVAGFVSAGVDIAVARATSVAGIVFVFVVMLMARGIVVAAVVAIVVTVVVIVLRCGVVSEMRRHIVHSAHTHRAVRIVGNVVIIVVVVIGGALIVVRCAVSHHIGVSGIVEDATRCCHKCHHGYHHYLHIRFHNAVIFFVGSTISFLCGV